jgi:hypothetical protein
MGLPIRVEVKGLKEIQRMLRSGGDELLAEPYREMMDKARKAGEESAQSRAPHASGQLRSSITSRLQASAMPRYAVIKTTATRSSRRYSRYPYPKRLEFDPRSKHRDWLLKSLERVQGTVQGLVNAMGRKVESRWSSGR